MDTLFLLSTECLPRTCSCSLAIYNTRKERASPGRLWPLDPDDDADFGYGGGAPARADSDPLDPLAHFMKELEGLSSVSGPV